jgi:hypothetical protein
MVTSAQEANSTQEAQQSHQKVYEAEYHSLSVIADASEVAR